MWQRSGLPQHFLLGVALPGGSLLIPPIPMAFLLLLGLMMEEIKMAIPEKIKLLKKRLGG